MRFIAFLEGYVSQTSASEGDWWASGHMTRSEGRSARSRRSSD